MQYRQLGPGLVQQIQTVCHKCSGQGNVIAEKDKCKTCEGKKVAQDTKEIEVHVDKGMTHGMKITMAGEGDEEVSKIKIFVLHFYKSISYFDNKIYEIGSSCFIFSLEFNLVT